MAKFKDLLGLFVLFVVICIACVVGYVAYSIANEVAAKTQEKMEKKNIKVSRDGLKVGLKQVSSDQVADSTQNYRTLMKIWNQASWPEYKSRLGWGSSSATAGRGGSEYRAQ
jgi:hypothetical protein